MKLYLDLFSQSAISNRQSAEQKAECGKQKAKLKELHLGGGTPTFFSPENLRILLEGIFSTVEIAENPEFSLKVTQTILQKYICKLCMI